VPSHRTRHNDPKSSSPHWAFDFIRESLTLDAAHNKWIKTCTIWDDDVLGVWPSSDFVLVEVLRVTKESADGVGIVVEAANGSVLMLVFIIMPTIIPVERPPSAVLIMASPEVVVDEIMGLVLLVFCVIDPVDIVLGVVSRCLWRYSNRGILARSLYCRVSGNGASPNSRKILER
jgi:hypothetical protein